MTNKMIINTIINTYPYKASVTVPVYFFLKNRIGTETEKIIKDPSPAAE